LIGCVRIINKRRKSANDKKTTMHGGSGNHASSDTVMRKKRADPKKEGPCPAGKRNLVTTWGEKGKKKETNEGVKMSKRRESVGQKKNKKPG